MSRIEDDQEAQFAMIRSPEQIRISKRFPFRGSESSIEFEGQAARFAYKVFDISDNIVAENDNGLELVLRETPTRQQHKVLFLEDFRHIPRVLFQRFNAEGQQIKREKFVLSATEIRDMMLFLCVIRSPSLPPDDDEFGISLTTAAALEVMADDRESARLLEDMKPALAEMCQWPLVSPRRRSRVLLAYGHGFSLRTVTRVPCVVSTRWWYHSFALGGVGESDRFAFGDNDAGVVHEPVYECRCNGVRNNETLLD